MDFKQWYEKTYGGNKWATRKKWAQ
jgi:hypothetical protein